jgi:hypothetical protein
MSVQTTPPRLSLLRTQSGVESAIRKTLSQCQSFIRHKDIRKAVTMSDLFDRLQNELDILQKEDGVTPLDLAELPTPLRRIMRKMLRAIELEHDAVAKIFEDLPEEERTEVKNLDAALKILSKQGWLIVLGEEDNRRYKVNLRRKRGSELAADIFNKLDDRLSERKPPDIKPSEDEDSS